MSLFLVLRLSSNGNVFYVYYLLLYYSLLTQTNYFFHSLQVIDIDKQLKTCPIPAVYIDDFIMQILQNPIKFSAYNFYDLNLATVFKVSCITICKKLKLFFIFLNIS